MIKTRIFANLSAFSAPELPLHCRSAFQADRGVEEAFSQQDIYCTMHDYARKDRRVQIAGRQPPPIVLVQRKTHQVKRRHSLSSKRPSSASTLLFVGPVDHPSGSRDILFKRFVARVDHHLTVKTGIDAVIASLLVPVIQMDGKHRFRINLARGS